MWKISRGRLIMHASLQLSHKLEFFDMFYLHNSGSAPHMSGTLAHTKAYLNHTLSHAHTHLDFKSFLFRWSIAARSAFRVPIPITIY